MSSGDTPHQRFFETDCKANASNLRVLNQRGMLVTHARYGDIQWLTENRRWPPKLVEGMEAFLAIRPVA